MYKKSTNKSEGESSLEKKDMEMLISETNKYSIETFGEEIDRETFVLIGKFDQNS